MPRAAIALVVATLCGCRSPVTVLEEGLEITIEPEAFLLHNRDFGVPVHYAIVETRASVFDSVVRRGDGVLPVLSPGRVAASRSSPAPRSIFPGRRQS